VIRSNRDEYLGAHITVEMKKALKYEAKKQGISVSLLVFRYLVVALRKNEHDIKETF